MSTGGSNRPVGQPVEQAGGQPRGDDLAALEHAIASLEGQRSLLGDAVVDTALLPLRERRAVLLQRAQGEQRRLVTVVFADLVGFTDMSAWLDAEDTRNLVDAYFRRWLQVIERHGGAVEKFIGDAVMAVFGLRQSWEDDAQRAVRAALAMVADLDDLNVELQQRYGVSVHMRVGIDTGDVVVSTLGDRDGAPFVVVGQTVNRASRIQSNAPVDGVLISSDTHQQVRGQFNMQRRDGLVLKGIDEPVTAYRVTSERPQGFQLDRAGGVEGVDTTTVGRDLELRFLQERLGDVVEEQRWRVVTVLGDAGVGKSRLLLEFDSWLAERSEPVWWFRGRASHTGQNHANALLRDLVAGRFEISESDSADQVRRKLEDGFAAASEDATEAATAAYLVGSWLRFDLGHLEGAAVPADPMVLSRRAGAALAEYFARLARRAPVVVLLEDLHWADDASLRWLDTADTVLAQSPVLVVATARPTLLEDRPRWGEGLGHHVRLPLSPLSQRESRKLLRQILQHVEHPPDDLVDLVIDSAEGNPFYLEELVTWLIDTGVIVRGAGQWRVDEALVYRSVVPSTLRGVLQARLDALSLEERALLQRASVVGRVFWDEAVDRLATEPGSGPHPGPESLDRLRARELVFERELSSFDSTREFVFKHALLRDVAYDSVLRSHRQRYHARAAEWLMEASGRSGRHDEYAALIAEHFDRAADPRAGTWYFRAGRQAASVYALTEAAQLLHRALSLVTDDGDRFDVLAVREEMLDRVGDRDAQERDLTEMTELAERSADPRRLARMRLARSRFYFSTSDYLRAEEWAEAAAAETAVGSGGEADTDLAAVHAEALLWHGKALTWHDELDAARGRLTEALAEARTTDQPLVAAESLRYLSMLAHNEGRYEEALDLVAESREVFAALGDAEGEGTALTQQATTLYNTGRLQEARDTLERVVPIFHRAGHRYREALLTANIGTIAMTQGELAAARHWCTEAAEHMREVGDREATANCLVVLGQVAAELGEWDRAEQHYGEAVEIGRSVESRTTVADALSRWVFVLLERGDAAGALRVAEQADEAGELATSAMERGHAELARGYAELASGTGASAARAAESFTAAEESFHSVAADVLVREARVGRAAALLATGRAEDARRLVEDALPHLHREGLEGAARAATVLQTCWTVLAELDDPRAAEALECAERWLREAAERTGDPEMARRYLARPVNARLLVAAASTSRAGRAGPAPAPG